VKEHDFEPVWGLPGRLPAGEDVLWQGAPDWRHLARHALHIRLITLYIGGLWLVSAVQTVSAGGVETAGWLRMAAYLGLTLAAIGVTAGFAWLVGRTTAYTITNRRVVIRFGIALSKTINLPFALIDGANVRPVSGDVAIQMGPGQKVGYLVMWPHIRPWRLSRAEPMLRAVPDAGHVAQILGRALAAAAAQPAQAAPLAVRFPAGSVGRPVAA
jgi:hypothetical protein